MIQFKIHPNIKVGDFIQVKNFVESNIKCRMKLQNSIIFVAPHRFEGFTKLEKAFIKNRLNYLNNVTNK